MESKDRIRSGIRRAGCLPSPSPVKRQMAMGRNMPSTSGPAAPPTIKPPVPCIGSSPDARWKHFPGSWQPRSRRRPCRHLRRGNGNGPKPIDDGDPGHRHLHILRPWALHNCLRTPPNQNSQPAVPSPSLLPAFARPRRPVLDRVIDDRPADCWLPCCVVLDRAVRLELGWSLPQDSGFRLRQPT